jgi:membrane-associated phospholipid phosphatase
MESQTTAPGLWPVDMLLLAYFLAASLLIVLYWEQIPGAGWLVLLHAGVMLLVGLAWGFPSSRTQGLGWFLRNWYPLLCVAAAYKEMGILIPALRSRDADAALARLDFALWGVNPTVWLERIQTRALTEFLQIIYSLFLPAVLLVAAVFWARRRSKEFRYYLFLISLGFLVSYVGYLLVPARGPRFLLNNLQTRPLAGRWSFQFLRGALDWLEGIQYDCFPSGHTEVTLLAWWSARRISKRLFWTYSAYTMCMVFATVYLRYHYSIDAIAGALLAVALLAAAPCVYGSRQLHGTSGNHPGQKP